MGGFLGFIADRREDVLHSKAPDELLAPDPGPRTDSPYANRMPGSNQRLSGVGGAVGEDD
jgi:hypothetical protein